MPQMSYIRQRNLQARNGIKKGSSLSQRTSKKSLINKHAKKNDDYRELQVTESGASVKGLAFPGGAAAFRALVSARFCGAVWCHITDCDEVFNYWEPLHYLVYGWGLQTWEYSSAYALRSYSSLWLWGSPALLLEGLWPRLAPGPPMPFYLTRCGLALANAGADLYMYKGVCQEFGVNVGRLWLAFSLLSSGGFISSSALLPSAWCGPLASLALAAWWRDNPPVAIVATAVATLLGWPFAGLIGLPIAIDMIFRQKQLLTFLHWTFISLTFVLGPMVYIDSVYYGQLVVAPLNLIKYNIFTDHGPDLYGTEPWSYYIVNGFLNFNVIWIMCLLCPLLLCSYWSLPSSRSRANFCHPYWLSLMPLYSWLVVFLLQPHKEERFLFPVYSMICLCGAIGVDCLQKIAFRFNLSFTSFMPSAKSNDSGNSHYAQKTAHIMIAFIVISSILGVSRSVALYRNYHAPMDILRGLSEESLSPSLTNVNVCYGKEWHRFPSSFLFPDERFKVKFIKSEFKGMLPGYYSTAYNATMLAPDHFNDMNKEDIRLYTDISECHYLVDSTIGEQTALEPRYSEDTKRWTLIANIPFLDSAKSDKLFRAFYIPLLSDLYVTFGEYHLLRSTKLKVS